MFNKIFITMFLVGVLMMAVGGAGLALNAEAESIPAHATTGYYHMAQGEVYELRCDDNPDGVQPAVNVHLVNGEWRIIAACPQMTVYR